MNKNHKLISPTAGSLIPEALRSDTIDLERLLKAYYEWSESAGGFTKESKLLLENFSYKTADEAFLKMFKESLLRLFPEMDNELLRHLLKFSKSFYAQRGSVDSYEFLFKALWGDSTVSLTYPSEYILRSSDGHWHERQLIQLDVSHENLDTLSTELSGTLLYGETSESRAFINDIINIDKEHGIATVHISNVLGNFLIDEVLSIYGDIHMSELKTQVRPIAVVGDYNILNPGLGYIPDREISIQTEGDGKGFRVKISGVDGIDGKITSLDIIDTGINYFSKMPTLDLSDIYLFDVTQTTRKAASIQFKLVANYKESGSYLEEKSLLSDKWKLRDGEYYQEYSYVINTKIDKNKVMPVVNELLHPAGLAAFHKKTYDSADTVYVNLSDSYYSSTSKFTKKTDGLARYSNYVYYSTPGLVYL